MSSPQEGVGALYAVVLDVNRLDICATFWAQLLGLDVLYQDERYLRLGRQGERPSFLLQQVPEPHAGKNRMHIDLDVTDLEASVQCVQELGGRHLKIIREHNIAWAVMADPEGNEFCLVNHG